MSAPTKLRGGTSSELTRFKRLWLSLAEPARDFWRERFASEATQAQLRAELLTKLKIKLVADKQLTAFRQWLEEQDARDAEALQTNADEQELISLGLTGDALRQALIEKIQGRAYLQGDAKTGLAAVDRDLKQQSLAFEQEKFKEGLRTKLESAFNELALAVKGNPSAEEHIRKARELIAPAK